MNNDDILKEMQFEILQKIGLPIPKELIIYTHDDENWRYNNEEKTFNVPTNINLNNHENKYLAYYSLTHETMHMIQDFLLYTFPNVENSFDISINLIQSSLSSFFNNSNISITSHDFETFKNFLTQTHMLEKPLFKQLKFDSDFYVSYSDIKCFIENNFLSIPPNHIYTNNSLEISANYFTTQLTYNKMQEDGVTAEEMHAFRNKIKDFLPKTNDIEKTLDDFNLQLNIHNFIHPNRTTKIQNVINKIINFNKYKTNKLSPIFSNYEFRASGNTLSKLFEDTQNIINEISIKYKTESQLKKEEEDKLKAIKILESLELSFVTQIPNFKADYTDEGKYYSITFNCFENQLSYLEKLRCTLGVKEVVVDMTNKRLFIFNETRIATSNSVEKQDKSKAPSSNITEPDDHNLPTDEKNER